MAQERAALGEDDVAARDEALAVQLMTEHLQHVQESLAFDRRVPSHDVAMALS